MSVQHSRAVFFVCAAALAVASLVPLVAENPEHVTQLRETRKCPGCDLREAMLDGVNVELGDLRDADLRLARLYKANLRGADLTGALLTGANLTGADLRDTKGADLIGAETDERTKCPDRSMGPCN